MSSKVDRDNLDTRVYNKIKELILCRSLEPGQQIVQDQLAEELGVSRTPVRRALTQLAKENLVIYNPRGQTYVRSFSNPEIISVYEIRAVLEGLACRLLARKVTDEQIQYLRSLFDIDLSDLPSVTEVYLKSDREFHASLPKLAGEALLNNVQSTFHILFSSLTHRLVRPPKETYGEHMAIIDALEAHDSDLAEEKARQHIRHSIDKMLELETR